MVLTVFIEKICNKKKSNKIRSSLVNKRKFKQLELLSRNKKSKP